MKKQIHHKKPKINFDILSLFPEVFSSYLNESLMKKAITSGLIDVRVHNIREYVERKKTKGEWEHLAADDKPFGGGVGMVIGVPAIYKAISKLRKKKTPTKKVIVLSPRGKKLTATYAQELSKCTQLVFICGRYEGVDERVAQYIADESVSIGDYVLSGGELPALVAIEAISRFIPGFLQKSQSLEEENGSVPVYTRPAIFTPQKGAKSWDVPPVLLSGDHKKIEEWRKNHDDRKRP